MSWETVPDRVIPPEHMHDFVHYRLQAIFSGLTAVVDPCLASYGNGVSALISGATNYSGGAASAFSEPNRPIVACSEFHMDFAIGRQVEPGWTRVLLNVNCQ